MAENKSSRGEQEVRQDNRSQSKKGGTGQQTGGERGQKPGKDKREGYRGSDQKQQRGNNGGNR